MVLLLHAAMIPKALEVAGDRKLPRTEPSFDKQGQWLVRHTMDFDQHLRQSLNLGVGLT